MFERTDHHLAPWDLIAADQKRFARVRVLEVLNERVEQGMHRWGTPVPSLDEIADVELLDLAPDSCSTASGRPSSACGPPST